MIETGIIVNGHGDFNSLKARFMGACRILKTDGPRGHTASIQEIVTNSYKQISMLLDDKCKYIILMIDFEMRTVDYDEFVLNLKREFCNAYKDCHLNVAVPNRMIENWYLADITFLSQQKAFLKKNIKQNNYEGKHGKNELKKCFKKGTAYSETTHGQELFKSLRFEVARHNSPSFNRFLLLVEGNFDN